MPVLPIPPVIIVDVELFNGIVLHQMTAANRSQSVGSVLIIVLSFFANIYISIDKIGDFKLRDLKEQKNNRSTAGREEKRPVSERTESRKSKEKKG